MKISFEKYTKRKHDKQFALVRCMAIVRIYINIKKFKNRISKNIDDRLTLYTRKSLTASHCLISQSVENRAKNIFRDHLNHYYEQKLVSNKFEFYISKQIFLKYRCNCEVSKVVQNAHC
jgi:hypothetical protein